ncbi:MAG: beta-N-acetylhexosaminidase, partial [Gemmatimonadota bacterium]
MDGKADPGFPAVACLFCLALLACAPARREVPATPETPEAPETAEAREAAAEEPDAARRVHVVPWPRSVTSLPGSFELSDPVRIVTRSPAARVREVATFFADVVRDRTGFEVRVEQQPEGGGARFDAEDDGRRGRILLDVGLIQSDVAESESDHPDPEAYALRVAADGVTITGASPTGLLWGVQTLRQLLPPEFEDPDGENRTSWSIPAVEIEDAPRFAWRGSLMDVVRHFFPVDFVKRYVDLLSRYKMNVLHWHLTDDQGWRLEIEGYPRLTDVAAWRTEPDGSRHGGYYTREEVREVVEYARLRGVRVVPEIEMPGHSSAALVAYPGLACADPPTEVPNSWGVFRDIYCVGSPETFTFLEDVLTEVAELFPSEFVHIGGDEVPKVRWEECESCRELMRREGLADEDELQAWFLRRIERHLGSLGKTMIGWDEVLEGGGVPGSIVQVWRDPATIREAVGRGHDVIASPTSHAYFDYSPAALPLEQVYAFDPEVGLTNRTGGAGRDAAGEAAAGPATDPAPETSPRVLGGEGNLWSEYITTANFDFQAFPRLLALAEVLWSPAAGAAASERSFGDFEARLDADQYPRLRAMGVRPGPEASDVIRMRVGTDSLTGAPRVGVETSVAELEVRYTTDGSTPTSSSPLLADTTTFSDGDDATLGMFAGGDPLPIRRGFSVVDHLARGRPLDLERPPDMRYPGPGPDALTNGLRGSEDHRDGIWQGWWDNDLEGTIDLGTIRTIRSVEL